MKNKLSLNGFRLKLTGWAFTLCALLAAVLFPYESTGVPKLILSYLSYISLPIFAFLLVEGFAYTESMEKYIISVFLAALITEPFYDYVCIGSWLSLEGVNGQNILFALGFGLIQLWFLRYMGTGSAGRKFASISLGLGTACWMFILNVPGGMLIQLLVCVFYLLHDHPRARDLTAGALSLVFSGTGVLSLPLIHFYNGERGSYNKYIFYIAYPAAWAAAALIKLLAA